MSTVASLSDVGPSERLDLIPLNRMLESHVVPHAVRVREGFGARGNGTSGRVAGVMMLQMSPHRADILQRPTTERTPITVLLMMVSHHLLVPEVRLAALVLARRRGAVGGGGRRLLLLVFLSRLMMVMVRRRDGWWMMMTMPMMLLVMAVVVVVSRALCLIEPVICNHHHTNVTTSHHHRKPNPKPLIKTECAKLCVRVSVRAYVWGGV